MADLLTKVQGAVVDLESGGNNGGTGTFTETQAIIQEFEIGETWITSKTAENFYDKTYVACLDTPHPVYKNLHYDWWLKYRTEIPFENKFIISPILDLSATTDSVAGQFCKFAEYDGGYVLKKDPFDIYFRRNNSDSLLTGTSPSTTIPDFGYIDYSGDGNRWFYGASTQRIVRSTNPEVQGTYEEIFTYGYAIDDFYIYTEGNDVYVATLVGSLLSCVKITHGSEIAPFYVYENVDLSSYIVNGSCRNMPVFYDELFFQGDSILGDNYRAIHKINIKTGFITQDFITQTLVETMIEDLGFLGVKTFSASYNTSNTYFNGAMIDTNKSITFNQLYGFLDTDYNSGSTWTYISIRFSRLNGLEVVLTNTVLANTFYNFENKYFINGTRIYKDVSSNEYNINVLESYTQTYNGYTFVSRTNSNYTQANMFYGSIDDYTKNYAVLKTEGTTDYYVCGVRVLTDEDFENVAYIPAMSSGDPTLQVYMRIR